uniref:Uncharacterized protein n=1 Tax=Tetranychus urticae TaxID=32264 RepID=T1JQJ9_TETUR
MIYDDSDTPHWPQSGPYVRSIFYESSQRGKNNTKHCVAAEKLDLNHD